MILYILLLVILLSILLAVWVYGAAIRKGRKLKALFMKMDQYYDQFLKQWNEIGLNIDEIMDHSLFLTL